MFKMLRLLGFLNHSPRSIEAERIRLLNQTVHDIDLLAVHLDQVRGEMSALRGRKERLTKLLAEKTVASIAIPRLTIDDVTCNARDTDESER